MVETILVRLHITSKCLNFPRFQHVSGADRLNNKELAKATGVSETFWKQGKCMALTAGLVEEHLASILSNLDKKDGDIVARMMKIKPLLFFYNFSKMSILWFWILGAPMDNGYMIREKNHQTSKVWAFWACQSAALTKSIYVEKNVAQIIRNCTFTLEIREIWQI